MQRTIYLSINFLLKAYWSLLLKPGTLIDLLDWWPKGFQNIFEPVGNKLFCLVKIECGKSEKLQFVSNSLINSDTRKKKRSIFCTSMSNTLRNPKNQYFQPLANQSQIPQFFFLAKTVLFAKKPVE